MLNLDTKFGCILIITASPCGKTYTIYASVGYFFFFGRQTIFDGHLAKPKPKLLE